MTSFAFKENTGSLFPRIDKENDRQPDARGRCDVNGEMFKIAAWKRTSATGIEYWSLAFTPEPKDRVTETRDAKLQEKQEAIL